MTTAKQWIVSPDGHDKGSGSGADPASWKAAAAQVAPGGSIILRKGAYSGDLVFRGHGLPDAPIEIIGEGFEDTVIRHGRHGLTLYPEEQHDKASGLLSPRGYIVVEGIGFEQNQERGLWVKPSIGVNVRECRFSRNGVHGFFSGYAHDLQLRLCEFLGNIEQWGAYISNSSKNVTVSRCLFGGNAGGLQVNADASLIVEKRGEYGDGIGRNIDILQCEFVGNGADKKHRRGAALQLASCRGGEINGCRFYRNYASAISLWDDGDTKPGVDYSTHGIEILQNVIYVARDEGRAVFSLHNGSSDNVIHSNAFVGAKQLYQMDESSSKQDIRENELFCHAGAGQMAIIEDRPDGKKNQTVLSFGKWTQLGYDKGSVWGMPPRCLRLQADMEATEATA